MNLPKIKLVNNCVEIDTLGMSSYMDVLMRSNVFTRHPSKPYVWYMFKTHKCHDFYVGHKDFFKKYWDVDADADAFLSEIVDYTGSIGLTPLLQASLRGIKLLPHQEKATRLMLGSKKFCVFLGQGSGKTYSALTVIKSLMEDHTLHLRTDYLNILIVTPKKVIGQWVKEITTKLDFKPTANQYVFHCYDDFTFITIVNFESLDKVANKKYDCTFYDESHRIKNPDSHVNKVATKIVSDRTYLLTGSPQDKNKQEILAQLKVLQPWLFPAKYKVNERYFYLDEYNQPIKEKPDTELNEIIVAMSYGEKSEALLTLPDAYHHQVECSFTDKKIYDTFKKHQVVEIDGHEIISDSPGSTMVKLRELCNGFIMFEDFDDDTTLMSKMLLKTENPKIEKLTELVQSMKTAVIFTQFDQDIVQITQLMDELNRSYVWVNGKVKDSETLIDKFKEGAVDFLIIQSQSGNAGLNLQNTNNMIFYSLPTSYIVFEQCQYRIRRIGQTKECNYYYLITKGTIETSMLRALNNKKTFSNKMFELYRKEE